MPAIQEKSLAWLLDNERLNFSDNALLGDQIECYPVGTEKPILTEDKARSRTLERWTMHSERCGLTKEQVDILALGFGPDRGPKYADSIYETGMTLSELANIRTILSSESVPTPQLLCWDWDGTVSVIEGMLINISAARASLNRLAGIKDMSSSIGIHDIATYYLGGQERMAAFLETYRLADSLGVKQMIVTANPATASIHAILASLFEEEGSGLRIDIEDVRYIYDEKWISQDRYGAGESTKMRLIGAALERMDTIKAIHSEWNTLENIHRDIELSISQGQAIMDTYKELISSP